MNIKIRNAIVGVAIAFASNAAMAQPAGAPFQSLTFSGDGITDISVRVSEIHPAAMSIGRGFTYDLFLDSTDDILVIDATLNVCGGGSIFNVTEPQFALDDHTPPNPALLSIPGFEVLNADTWVTTPGGTSAAGSASLIAGETVSHFDTTDGGALSDFHWARISFLLPEIFGAFRFDATIQTAATPTPEFSHVTLETFSFACEVGDASCCRPVPEPNALALLFFALLGGLSMVRRKF